MKTNNFFKHHRAFEIQIGREASQKTVNTIVTIVQRKDHHREFFRHLEGSLVEYDLTVYDGRPVLLNQAELDAINEFEYNSLPDNHANTTNKNTKQTSETGERADWALLESA